MLLNVRFGHWLIYAHMGSWTHFFHYDAWRGFIYAADASKQVVAVEDSDRVSQAAAVALFGKELGVVEVGGMSLLFRKEGGPRCAHRGRKREHAQKNGGEKDGSGNAVVVHELDSEQDAKRQRTF